MKHKYEMPKRCYESHPPLPVGAYLIYGGSCISPVVMDADIYIGFDSGMRKDPRQFPWEAGESFLYPIQDMGVPTDIASFKKLIHWVSLQLIAGKKVHMGCIGGHGRTGLVMAALVTYMTGNVDSITYVRENYCEKVVESQQQVDFLHHHFGITKTMATKGGNAQWGNWDNDIPTSHTGRFNEKYAGKGISKPPKDNARSNRGTREGENGTIHVFPARNLISIWGQSFKMTVDSR